MLRYSKINIGDIIKDHLATLVNADTKRPDYRDYMSFLVIPITIAVLCNVFGVRIHESIVDTIVGSLSIFVGLLFNAFIMLLDIGRKQEDPKLKTKILKEISANIGFDILLAIPIITFVLLTSMLKFPIWMVGITKVFEFIAYFFIAEFLMVFLMVMKRIYKIMTGELDIASRQKVDE